MSHDLRSPLTSLLGYLELLDEEETEDAAQQKHLDVYKRQLLRTAQCSADHRGTAGRYRRRWISRAHDGQGGSCNRAS